METPSVKSKIKVQRAFYYWYVFYFFFIMFGLRHRISIYLTILNVLILVFGLIITWMNIRKLKKLMIFQVEMNLDPQPEIDPAFKVAVQSLVAQISANILTRGIKK